MAPVLVVLYDGTCGICTRSVRFLLARDRRRWFAFAPLAGATAEHLRHRHRSLGGIDSFVAWLPGRPGSPERVVIATAAILVAARALGCPRWMIRICRLIPRTWRDRAYVRFAARRHLVPVARSCPLLPLADRRRFLP